jgi:hypothetical protein
VSHVTITGGGVATFYRDVSNVSGSAFKVDVNSTAIFLGTLTGLSSITGSGTKYFAGMASGGPLASGGFSIVETGASLSTDFVRENSLSVDGVATLLPSGSPTHYSRLTQLAINSGGKFDLSDNDLIVDSTPISTIAAKIAAGFNGGSWNGAGITSSAAQASGGSAHPTALAYATAASLGLSLFDGQSVSGLNVLVRHTYSGDANLDRVVNALDFNALASNFGASGKLWVQGDFNFDGIANTLDFNSIATNFNLALPPAASTLETLLPEPGSAYITAICALVLSRRRRQ